MKDPNILSHHQKEALQNRVIHTLRLLESVLVFKLLTLKSGSVPAGLWSPMELHLDTKTHPDKFLL